MFENILGVLDRDFPVNPEIPALIDNNIFDTLKNTEVHFLGHYPDNLFCQIMMGVNIMIKYLDPAGGFIDQPGKNTDDRCLSGPVSAQ